jgi:hypothetical protein
MQTLDRHSLHFIGNRMAPILGQPVHTGSHQKMCSDLLRCAEQLLDIALSITNVDTALGIIEKRGGLP